MRFTPTKMAAKLLLLCYCTGLFVQMTAAQPSSPVNFQDLYEAQWSADHIQIVNNGAQVNVVLDKSSGAGFNSIQAYTYGYFSASMKLIPGYSAGTVSAFFISSGGNAHDEIDFEFLGNVTGQPYGLNTNLFAAGVGGREERFNLWFDPTAAFHTYSVIWNHVMIVWFIDNQPIRVFKNLESIGIAYPSSQAAQALGSLFDGSSWATQNGGAYVPVNYAFAPFTVSYSQFVIDACVNDGINVPACAYNYTNNWWEGPAYTSLTPAQISNLQEIQNTYRYYDYCKDTIRYPAGHPECSYNYN